MTWVAVWLAVFMAACGYDFANTRYIRARRKHEAARWSVATYAVGIVGTIGVLKVSYWLVSAEVLGLYAGTWLGFREDAP